VRFLAGEPNGLTNPSPSLFDNRFPLGYKTKPVETPEKVTFDSFRAQSAPTAGRYL